MGVICLGWCWTLWILGWLLCVVWNHIFIYLQYLPHCLKEMNKTCLCSDVCLTLEMRGWKQGIQRIVLHQEKTVGSEGWELSLCLQNMICPSVQGLGQISLVMYYLCPNSISHKENSTYVPCGKFQNKVFHKWSLGIYRRRNYCNLQASF